MLFVSFDALFRPTVVPAARFVSFKNKFIGFYAL